MRIAPVALAFLIGCPALATAAPARRMLLPPPPRMAFAPREVLALVAPGSALALVPPGAALRAADPALAALLVRHGITGRQVLLPRDLSHARKFEALRLLSDAPDFDPRSAAADLVASGAALAAAPNLNLRLHFTPNDPFLPNQWQFSTSAAGVRMRPAWDIERGSASVVIGILDTGVDTGHEDLAARIWHNPGEIPGNGIDDEGDGYIDDVTGWDFGNGDNDPNPEPLIDPNAGIDEGWHGTFVAGLAGATTNNGVGVAGVAHGCRILPLKVSNTAGDIPLAAVTSAIDYAAAHHLAVLNLSLGTSDSSARAFFQPLVNEAVTAGVVVVASAGNDGTDAPTYPAACDSVLAVAATNTSNNRASFSNWGAFVDLAAPGEAVWSCIARNYPYDDTSLLFFEILWGYDAVNPYMSNDGTSFSSPIAAGAAALVRSHFPALTPQQVMRQLVLDGDLRTYDNPIGPRLNIEKALQQPLAVAPEVAGVATAAFAAPSPNPATHRTRLTFTLPQAGSARVVILDAQGRTVRVLLDQPLTAGTHAAVWKADDDQGAPVAPGLYFAILDVAGARAARRVAIVR